MSNLYSNFRKTYSAFLGLGSARNLKIIYSLLFVLIIFRGLQYKSASQDLKPEILGTENPEITRFENLTVIMKGVASEHNLDYSLLSCVLKVESNYRMGVISETNDYGIGQVNELSIKQHKLDKHLLLTDMKYAINATAKLLKGLQTRLKSDYERQWPCAYNIGVSGLLRGQKGAACEVYLEKLNNCVLNNDYL